MPATTFPQEMSFAVTGSAPGWPLVLYFHHVHPELDHYTSLTPRAFAEGLATVFDLYGPPLDPAALDGPPPGEPTVLITFDDGHRDTLEHAVPVLDRYGARAVFFAITGRAGDPAHRDAALTWPELAALGAAGHRIGAHTTTHRKLPELTAAEQAAEIGGSLGEVAERLGGPAPPLAYPYGLPPTASGVVPSGSLAFGTVKAAPLPWATAPHLIRRTCLPVGHERHWPSLCREWRDQWSRPSHG
ncbi:polysaccharide deacetylase family protein [Spongiactinospora sp. TRM90649]|uniref:polysaccharide deacetylase family protein n=1 Tax=Spongiactinospora sp. TRM90649 TaxID=3031114 RepID=UPI0023F92EAF|nr:polysaccharide deacetylase family protein [Spongiactinospora sp. TRM90649]MDF5757684.1 polysaccharide deacetylase family protein [Spongiactinospora sp. TRM90649]